MEPKPIFVASGDTGVFENFLRRAERDMGDHNDGTQNDKTESHSNAEIGYG